MLGLSVPSMAIEEKLRLLEHKPAARGIHRWHRTVEAAPRLGRRQLRHRSYTRPDEDRSPGRRAIPRTEALASWVAGCRAATGAFAAEEEFERILRSHDPKQAARRQEAAASGQRRALPFPSRNVRSGRTRIWRMATSPSSRCVWRSRRP